MLVEFRVANHRSIREEQVLTMEASKSLPHDARPRQIAGHTTPLLPAVALYGANASGKSNILSAIQTMGDAVLRSHRLWSPEGGIPRTPFGWGPARSQPSLMEITVIIDKTRYQYGFSADDDRFLEEWLYAWPQGRRRQQWLLRTGDRFKFGDYLQGENHLIQELTRPNSLFLSAAAQNRHRQLSPLYRWFASIRTLLPNPPFTAWPIRSSSTLSFNEFIDSINLLTHAKRHSQQSSPFPPEQPGQDIDQAFLDLLRATDVGILNFRLVKPGGTARTGVLVQHQSDSPDAWLPLEEESQGTQTLFRIGPLILEALAQGSLLIVDELEASLHPLLGQRIVEHFNQPALNPRHAQILFTTHDTNLLGSLTETPPLRRDQVWLTEKDRDGATVLYPLTDYRPQKGENLERGYLQGRFGAIPRIQDWMPREEWAAE